MDISRAIARAGCFSLGAAPVIVLLVIASSSGEHRPLFRLGFAAENFLSNVSALLLLPEFPRAVLGSVQFAAVAASGGGILGLVVAICMRGSLSIRARWVLGWAVMGALFTSPQLRAFAAVVTLSATAESGAPTLAYTFWGAALYSSLSVAPYLLILLLFGFERISDEQIRCAKNLGAGWRRIVEGLWIPTVRPVIASAWLCGFALAFGDAIAPSTVGGNKFPNLPAWAVDQFRIASIPLLATIGLFQMVTVAVLFVVAARRSGETGI